MEWERRGSLISEAKAGGVVFEFWPVDTAEVTKLLKAWGYSELLSDFE